MADRVLAREGRVAVRKFKRSDLQERLSWPPYTEPLFQHLNFDLSTFIEREKWLFARMMNAGRMYFAIEDEKGGFIGEISLREIDTSAKAGRLGIHLASDKVRMGYGREAMLALLRHYFTEMKWNVLYLDVAAFNDRAIRLYERLHFDRQSDFWRKSADVSESVFTDPRFAAIRRFARRFPGGVEVLHHDMALTSQRYFSAFKDTCPSSVRPACPD